MGTYIIKKKVKANSIGEAVIKEPFARIRDVYCDEDDEEEEEIIMIPGFVYCEEKHKHKNMKGKKKGGKKGC